MSPEKIADKKWIAVDQYLTETLKLSDDALEAALAANKAAKLPSIDVTATQGKLLQMLAQMVGARNILEMGTLGGYSTIWLARGLPPGGRLISLEYNPKHAEVARANIARAGLSDIVDIRVGAALESLPKLLSNLEKPFDLIFIDADKPNNPEYFRWALRLSRPGTLIIVDNVVRDGAVADGKSKDKDVVGTREMFALMGTEPRVSCTAIQTVGTKGYDGLAFAIVTAEA